MSGFTALNGGSGSPKTAERNIGRIDAQIASPQERTGAQPPSSEGVRAAEVPTSQREGDRWSSQNHNRPLYSSELKRINTNTTRTEPGTSNTQQTTSYPDIDGPHKRKRSEGEEGHRERRPSTPTEERQRSERATGSRDPYGTPQREYRSFGDEGRERHDGWHSRGREDLTSYDQRQQSRAQSTQITDEQIGETLRRATAASQLEGSDYGTSPDGDEPMSMYSGQYTPEQRRDGVMQSDAKKRKRNFSNRTKTGCLTCRKRKKKCDEAKPECSNCVRGGFVCAGYPPQRGAWPKPENKPATVQIESKDPTYIPPGAYGMPQQQPPPPPPQQQQQQQQQTQPGPHGNQPLLNPQHQKREPLPAYRGQALRIDPPQGRPLLTDDDRHTASTLPSSIYSPENKLSALSAFANPANNVFPTPLSAAPMSAFTDRTTPMDRTPKEYQRVPPLHDLSRTEPEMPHEGLPRISVLGATRTNSPSFQPPQGQQQQSQQPLQGTAALALSHAQFPSDRHRSQKDEMINGRAYYPFDMELVLERERCSAACWRFNNSTNPNIGVSPAERARLFREILHPATGIQISPAVTSPVTHAGRVGDKSTVEAPFVCDYGYNIQIGNFVSIGRNCLINDVCEVKIGNNVLISPNVSIYTGTASINPDSRRGNRGPQYGKPVKIGNDVWIGANVVILPGVTIGDGVTVGAGSVVVRDLAPFTVCCGRTEAHVIRGIAK